MEAFAEVVRGVELDDAAHFAAVFGGEVGGEDADGLDVVGFDFGAEAGGAIVLEGDAVDDDLGLVFGAAGVEDGVAFVEPAGLGVDEVLEGAAGNGAGAVFDLFAADAVDAAGAVGIDEGVGLVDLDGAAGGGDGELGGEVGGRGGADFYGLREGGEAVAADRDGVDAVGEALEGGGAGFVGGVGLAEIVYVTGDSDGGADGGAGGIGDFEAEVAGVGLGFRDAGRKQKKRKEKGCCDCAKRLTDQAGHPPANRNREDKSPA